MPMSERLQLVQRQLQRVLLRARDGLAKARDVTEELVALDVRGLVEPVVRRSLEAAVSLGQEEEGPREVPGLDSARALLVGLEVTSVSFVRDWVELLLEDEARVAAFTAPRGVWASLSWHDPTDLRPMLNYINQTVVDFQVDETSSAELTFEHENTFVVPLDDRARKGPEALHIVGVPTSERQRPMWIW
jgi:hypothetical protein